MAVKLACVHVCVLKVKLLVHSTVCITIVKSQIEILLRRSLLTKNDISAMKLLHSTKTTLTYWPVSDNTLAADENDNNKYILWSTTNALFWCWHGTTRLFIILLLTACGFDSRLLDFRVPTLQCSYTCASVTKQYNLVMVKGRWCSVAGKVTVGPVSHLPCVSDSVVYQSMDSLT